MPSPIITPYVDGITKAAVVLDSEHHMIHKGVSFTTQYEASGAGAGEETAIGFVTPAAASGRVHFTFDAWASLESVLELREDPAVVLGSGAAKTTFCRDRTLFLNSKVISQAVAGVAGQVTTYNVAQAAAGGLAGGGILHHETLAIGDVAPFHSGLNAVARGRREFALKPSTEYVVILTQSGVGAAVHNLILNWYEHVHGDWAN